MHTKENLTTKHTLIAMAATAFLFIALGLAGRSDRDDYVLMHMPLDTYQAIKYDLSQKDGGTPSEHEVVEEYLRRNGDD